MDDLDLDRELQAALDVTPAPEFLARVRGAIAMDLPIRVLPAWLVPSAGGICVISAVLLWLFHPRFSPIDQAAFNSHVAVIRSTPVRIEARPTLTTTIRSIPAREAGPQGHDVPVVLVSTAERQAFVDLIAALREDPFVVMFEEPPVFASVEMTALTEPPITIDSLEPPPVGGAYN